MKAVRIYLLAMFTLLSLPSFAQQEGKAMDYAELHIPFWAAQTKMAFDGTWRYENNDTIFIIHLKGLYNNLHKSDFFLLSYYGTYTLKIGNLLIEDNSLSLFKLKNICFNKDLAKQDFELIPISLFTTSLEYTSLLCSKFKDVTRVRQNGNFYVRADICDSSNEHISFDFADRDKDSHFYLYGSDTEPKGNGFSVPTKCVLTRISHDPYYELVEQ